MTFSAHDVMKLYASLKDTQEVATKIQMQQNWRIDLHNQLGNWKGVLLGFLEKGNENTHDKSCVGIMWYEIQLFISVGNTESITKNT